MRLSRCRLSWVTANWRRRGTSEQKKTANCRLFMSMTASRVCSDNGKKVRCRFNHRSNGFCWHTKWAIDTWLWSLRQCRSNSNIHSFRRCLNLFDFHCKNVRVWGVSSHLRIANFSNLQYFKRILAQFLRAFSDVLDNGASLANQLSLCWKEKDRPRQPKFHNSVLLLLLLQWLLLLS